jgi:hypothetical protein
MVPEPSPWTPWIPVISGAVGALIAFVLIVARDWWSRRKKHAAFWHAINAELTFCGGMLLDFTKHKVSAPLYRLPRSAFEKCYPELLADGALYEDESKDLMAFFNEIDTR